MSHRLDFGAIPVGRLSAASNPGPDATVSESLSNVSSNLNSADNPSTHTLSLAPLTLSSASRSTSIVGVVSNNDWDLSRLTMHHHLSMGDHRIPSNVDLPLLWGASIRQQERISELEAEVRRLTLEKTALEVKISGEKGASKKKGNTKDTREDSLIKLGQHCFGFWALHVEAHHLSRANLPTDWNWDDPDRRYANQITERQGITSECYAMVPDRFQGMMDSAGQEPIPKEGQIFLSHFISKGMRTVRSTVCSNARANAPQIFEGVAANLFAAAAQAQRAASPLLQRLSGRDMGPNPITNVSPPFMFLGEDPTAYVTRYQAVCLFRLGRSIYFGKTAISDKKHAVGRQVSMLFPANLVLCTTVGVIALVTTVGLFVLSPDESFDVGPGGKSTFNYVNFYDYQKRWLLRARKEHPEWYSALIKTWDNELFETHNKKKNLSKSGEGETIDLNDQADLLRHEMNMLSMTSMPSQMPASANAHVPVLASESVADSQFDDDFYVPHPHESTNLVLDRTISSSGSHISASESLRLTPTLNGPAAASDTVVAGTAAPSSLTATLLNTEPVASHSITPVNTSDNALGLDIVPDVSGSTDAHAPTNGAPTKPKPKPKKAQPAAPTRKAPARQSKQGAVAVPTEVTVNADSETQPGVRGRPTRAAAAKQGARK